MLLIAVDRFAEDTVFSQHVHYAIVIFLSHFCLRFLSSFLTLGEVGSDLLSSFNDSSSRINEVSSVVHHCLLCVEGLDRKTALSIAS